MTAYVLRFIACASAQALIETSSIAGTDSRLTAVEVSEARIFWCKQAQLSLFVSEYKKLHQKQLISSRSLLIKLTPFLDENDTIRLGGRIKNAPLAFSERHPIILPRHRISGLIINHAHKQTLHGGPVDTQVYPTDLLDYRSKKFSQVDYSSLYSVRLPTSVNSDVNYGKFSSFTCLAISPVHPHGH